MTDDALSIALDLARALEQGGVPYAIGGALALGIWAIPRATLDVDINVFIDDASMDRLQRCLTALGIHTDLDGLRAQSEASGLIVVRWRGVRVDLFTPSIEFSREAERPRVAVELRVLFTESLVALLASHDFKQRCPPRGWRRRVSAQRRRES